IRDRVAPPHAFVAFADAFFAAARMSGLARSKRSCDQRSPFWRWTVLITDVDTPTASAIALAERRVLLKNSATTFGSALATVVRGVVLPRRIAASTTSRTSSGASVSLRHLMRTRSRGSTVGTLALVAFAEVALGVGTLARRAADCLALTCASCVAIDAVTVLPGPM